MGGIVVLINNVPIKEYGAKLRDDYKISAAPLENAYFQGVKRSGFVLLSQVPGLKSLQLSIVFFGKDRREIDFRKSVFDGKLMGTLELYLDGYYYTVICNEIGDGAYQGECLMECEYEFTGYKHGKLVEVISNEVWCESTAPYTDCTLEVVTKSDVANYVLGTVTFLNVTVGEVLTVDGINKRILVNGIPAAERAEWIEFPSLSPGKNYIQCNDVPTVTFYPVYQ